MKEPIKSNFTTSLPESEQRKQNPNLLNQFPTDSNANTIVILDHRFD